MSHTLQPLDWTVIAFYGLGMVAVGVYYSFRAKTSDQYLLGGRTMAPWAVGLSLFATLLSTVSYIAVPGEMIQHGPTLLFMICCYPLIILVVGWLLIPRIMKFRVTTAYEILESRLGLSVRMLGAGIFLTMRILWMALIIHATTSKVLIPLSGLDPKWTWHVAASMGVVTLVYTSLGGLQAVVWTDVLQSFILFAAAVVSVALITWQLGGVGQWMPTRWEPHWDTFRVWPSSGARMTLMDINIAAFTWYVCTAGSDQMAIQRYLATRDAPAARRAFMVNQAADVIVLLFNAMMGFALLAYFRAFPERFAPGRSIATDGEMLFPDFVVRSLPVGLAGLVVAGLLAAAMSSLSSGMSSATSVITVDLIDRFRSRKLGESAHVLLAKCVSFAVGVLIVVLSLSYINQVEGNLLEKGYKAVNLLTAPLFLLFFMALFVPWATTAGTWVGAVCSIAVAILVAYWEPITGWPALSFTWIMPMSFILGAVAACVASWLTMRKQRGFEVITAADAMSRDNSWQEGDIK